MRRTLPTPHRRERLTAYFRSGERMRSRSVAEAVLAGTVVLPEPPPRLTADWQREIATCMALGPGEVEPMPLARARARWPDYALCVQAAADWLCTHAVADVLPASEVALMACRGAPYHHDAERYGEAAFCNLFVSEDKGLDVHFPHSGQRIPLRRGTVLLFDTGQPHAVIRRDRSGFDAADFALEDDQVQLFLTWELPIEHPAVRRALGVVLDVDAAAASQRDEGPLRLDGAPAALCPASGRWLMAVDLTTNRG